MSAEDGWPASLELHYRSRDGRTVAQDRHHGPLRVLKPLYPEGPGICHHVLVHPPGGLVGGDTLKLQATLESGTHALITTPGATRFYRSEGRLASQQVALDLAAGSRLEWLPLETIAHPGCRGFSGVRAVLAAGAEMIGWDLLALGLPASAQPFDGDDRSGHFTQQVEVPGVWLERARVAAADTLLLHSAVGWAGHTVLGTLYFASGSALAAPRRSALLDAARALVLPDAPWQALAGSVGVTSPQPGLVLLRVLAASVEPAMRLLRAARGAWRQQAWALAPETPRIWGT